MQIRSSLLLKQLFALQGHLSAGPTAPPREFGAVRIAPFRGGALAAASLSADFELSWAWRNLPPDQMRARGLTERANVPRILALLREHQIPVTWATVGHLFLDSCRGGHADMPRPATNYGWEGDWYRHDLGGDVAVAPEWFAPDLIEQIQRDPVPHEIGTHSFSHIDFAAEPAGSLLVRSEMEACRQAMRRCGAQPRSLVYCFNHMGHQHADLFAELGLTNVRHRDPKLRLAYPERLPAGIYRIYESMNLRVARFYDYPQKARIFLDEALRRNAAYHIWFHPSDDWKVFANALTPILALLAELRQQGRLWVATMADLAAYCEARVQTEIAATRENGKLVLRLSTALDEARFGSPSITLAIAGAPPARVLIHTGQSATETRPLGCREGEWFVDVPCRADRVEVG